ncbi:hypothetical protein ABK905_11695 [Acerihabitans sp. KWT182]|uniref:Uncharacterized protein n=1 Tax=Acerihabitans sp. KWT182 TaxID=3157919 RepID=A0AAU7QEP6_9GAMM
MLKRGENIDDALPFLQGLIDAWANGQPDPPVARRQALAAIADQRLLEKLGEVG